MLVMAVTLGALGLAVLLVDALDRRRTELRRPISRRSLDRLPGGES